MTDLQSLIARVEAATGPSEQLDIDIAVAASMVPPKMEKTFTSPRAWRGIYDNRYWFAPEYTASIDAALTLVPEGQGMKLDKYWIASVDRPIWHAAVTSPSKNPNVIVGSDYNEVWDCRTLALALCAAALRARAAQGEG